jgi:hypothetical protein
LLVGIANDSPGREHFLPGLTICEQRG